VWKYVRRFRKKKLWHIVLTRIVVKLKVILYINTWIIYLITYYFNCFFLNWLYRGRWIFYIFICNYACNYVFILSAIGTLHLESDLILDSEKKFWIFNFGGGFWYLSNWIYSLYFWEVKINNSQYVSWWLRKTKKNAFVVI